MRVVGKLSLASHAKRLAHYAGIGNTNQTRTRSVQLKEMEKVGGRLRLLGHSIYRTLVGLSLAGAPVRVLAFLDPLRTM